MKTSTLTQTKIMFVAFCCVVTLSSSVKAQSAFTIFPSNAMTVTLDCDSVKDLHFYIGNPNTFDINLDWKVKSNTMPLGNTLGNTDGCWDYMLCDWELCIMEIPSVGTVVSRSAIPAKKDSSDMKLTPLPGKIKGSGTLVIEVFEKSFPSNSKTITWNVTGCTSGAVCTAGISEAANNTGFSMYPNPAQDFVNVEITSGYSRNGSIEVYNVVGDKLIEFSELKTNIQKIDLTKLTAGAYFVKYSNGQGASVKKIFKTK